jgi:hypothetical protein
MRSDLGYNPPCYFWIAECEDQTALSQYDPETGKEAPFAMVDLARLKAFGWYPFSEALASKIGQVALPSALPALRIEVTEGNRLVAFRRQSLTYAGSGAVVGRGTLYFLGEQGKGGWVIDDSGNRIHYGAEDFRAIRSGR